MEIKITEYVICRHIQCTVERSNLLHLFTFITHKL